MNSILFAAIFSFFLTSAAFGQPKIILSADTVFEAGENIHVRVSNVPINDGGRLRYWVTLVPSDLPLGRYRSWSYVDRVGFEEVVFRNPGVGEYELRLHDYRRPGANANDYALFDRITIKVVERQAKAVVLDIGKSDFLFANESINVNVSEIDPLRRNWITLVPDGTEDGDWEEWFWLPRKETTATIEFTGVPEGKYEIRVHDSQRGYDILGRLGVDIKELTFEPNTCIQTDLHEAASARQRERVFQYLSTVNVVGDGLDELTSDHLLSQLSSSHGIVWWDVFGLLLTTQDVISNARSGDFLMASGIATNAIKNQIVPDSVTSSSIGSASKIGVLAALPIEWTLNAFARFVGKEAFENQLRLYAAARAAGWNHQRIMAGISEYPVVISDTGYILEVYPYKPIFRIPFIQQIDRVELYSIANLLHEADATEGAIQSSLNNALSAFTNCLADVKFAP